ncbi:hypothetical protein DSO57_1039795 [Entomophthora muscae]|uniref:Uncharacterized protein n=1 Tax=Entomophthora muscae TaxID=34485 RepID=A0ACC2SBK9_9FUNG|nr:hypothetical protein DSO57_1039795 [Entomophthora muscae]
MILDGGAYSNIILLPFLKTLPDMMVAPSDTVLIMANSCKSFSMGTAVHLTLWLGGVWMPIEAAIFNHKQYTLLIGQKTMSDLGITTRYTNNCWTVECNGKEFPLSVFFNSSHTEEFLCEPVARSIHNNPWLSPDQKVQLASVVDLFSTNIVEDSDNFPEASRFEHKIDTGDARPIASRFYCLSHFKESFVKSEVQRLLKQGLIKPSKSPWSFPLVAVLKKGGKQQMCVNCIPFNKVIISNKYPLPCISDILALFGGALWFSNIDLFSGFHQILVRPEDQPKTAFVTKWGQYKYTHMPFGLKNTPLTFQHIMNQVFNSLIWDFVTVYLDKIIIYSKTFV